MCSARTAISFRTDDPHDGAVTVAWVREQRWCDGTVGMYRLVQSGQTQWAAAAQSTPGLAAIAPSLTTTDVYLEPWYSPGGALSWHMLWSWTVLMSILAAKRAGDHGVGDPRL